MLLSENRIDLNKVRMLLGEAMERYNRPEFVENDPVSIPHLFDQKEDIEVSGFLTAAISWGQRKSILKSARQWMNMMGYEPYNFVLNASDQELKQLNSFVYRTFNSTDLHFFIRALRHIYTEYDGLEAIFAKHNKDIKQGIIELNNVFFELPHPIRTEKHLANPAKASAAKRINMFLRWMVRSDDQQIDFGLWKTIPTSSLFCPLDVHSANSARQLGLLNRKSNDWKAVVELTAQLRILDPVDPVKYDIALFGMGVYGAMNIEY